MSTYTESEILVLVDCLHLAYQLGTRTREGVRDAAVHIAAQAEWEANRFKDPALLVRCKARAERARSVASKLGDAA